MSSKSVYTRSEDRMRKACVAFWEVLDRNIARQTSKKAMVEHAVEIAVQRPIFEQHAWPLLSVLEHKEMYGDGQ